MGTICAERKGANVYYVYRESYREKIEREDNGNTNAVGFR
jgi:hypothetical protein